MIGAAALALAALTVSAAAQEIAPTAAVQTASVTDPPAPYDVAIAPASPMAGPGTLTLEGARRRTAWRAEPVPGAGLRLITELRETLKAAGFEVAFTCRTEACGGFDFRRSRPVLPMPDMIVDLSGFTYLSARRGAADAPEALASVLVSEGPAGAFAQLTMISPAPTPEATVGSSPQDAAPTPDQDVAEPDGEFFGPEGRAVLHGLAFAPGTADLPEEPPESLSALAAWMERNPGRRVALVGHTDWTGAPDLNRTLARARAATVAEALAARFGIDRGRLEVEGAGPFAPRSTNTTKAGRAANRRVEAVLLEPAE